MQNQDFVYVTMNEVNNIIRTQVKKLKQQNIIRVPKDISSQIHNTQLRIQAGEDLKLQHATFSIQIQQHDAQL